jgi:hypothetical protein
MTISTIGMAMIAPAKSGGGSFPVSTSTLIIIGIVVILGAVAILGWRSPASPHIEEKAEREDEE